MSILNKLLSFSDSFDMPTKGKVQDGELPLNDEMLTNWSSGDLFGLTQNAGMGWDPKKMLGPQFLLLSTQGGLRAPDGAPIALGFHTGHFEVGLLVEAAAKVIAARDGLPFAAYCSDPCDGRSQGTTGMFDSLPYRNDAAITMRRMIRSLPHRQGVLGIASWRRDSSTGQRGGYWQGPNDRCPLCPWRNQLGRGICRRLSGLWIGGWWMSVLGHRRNQSSRR